MLQNLFRQKIYEEIWDERPEYKNFSKYKKVSEYENLSEYEIS